MRFITRSGPGTIELSFMWLPVFIGNDPSFKREVDAKLVDKTLGKELTEDLLEALHQDVIDIICARYKIVGLRDYLDAVKFVEGPEA